MRRAGQATQHNTFRSLCLPKQEPHTPAAFAEGRRKVAKNKEAELVLTLNEQ
jgi:hypothetical protein